tara:strand:- start:1391 stop:1858 length:468 start_codon:yes stop_codon:yes gene_type:complete
MAWQDTLRQLRDELAEVRAERRQQSATEEAELKQARKELSDLAGSLGINRMLSEMNATLLDGKGDLETVVSWDADEGDAEEDEEGADSIEDEDGEEDDAITTILLWEERGEREVVVDVISTEDGTSVQVNGVDIRPDRDALEQALVEAFRDELEL